MEGVADDGIFYYGRTYAEAPEMTDTFTSLHRNLLNLEVEKVKILVADNYDLTGEVV